MRGISSSNPLALAHDPHLTVPSLQGAGRGIKNDDVKEDKK
jgi:hypothetical protein